MLLEVLACGSISTSNTLRPAAARYVARLIAVVVFPTPPFWLAIANTLDTDCYHAFRLTMLDPMEHIYSSDFSRTAIVTNVRARSNHLQGNAVPPSGHSKAQKPSPCQARADNTEGEEGKQQCHSLQFIEAEIEGTEMIGTWREEA